MLLGYQRRWDAPALQPDDYEVQSQLSYPILADGPLRKIQPLLPFTIVSPRTPLKELPRR